MVTAMVRAIASILSTIMVGEAGWTVQITNEAQPNPEIVENEHYFSANEDNSAVFEENNAETEYFEESDSEWEYLGSVRVTGYTWTGNTCANGNYPTSGYTVACNDLPIGTVVYIEGIGYRTVEDRGGMTRGTYWLDVYFDSVGECYAITGYYDAWVVSWP